jgi:hypothetical protein
MKGAGCFPATLLSVYVSSPEQLTIKGVVRHPAFVTASSRNRAARLSKSKSGTLIMPSDSSLCANLRIVSANHS